MRSSLAPGLGGRCRTERGGGRPRARRGLARRRRRGEPEFSSQCDVLCRNGTNLVPWIHPFREALGNHRLGQTPVPSALPSLRPELLVPTLPQRVARRVPRIAVHRSILEGRRKAYLAGSSIALKLHDDEG